MKSFIFQYGCREAFRRPLAALFVLIFAFVGGAMAQDRALIISLDSYADPKLAGSPPGLAENDAASIRKLLIEKLGYKSEQIKTLRNKQATKAAILTAISNWLGPADAGDAGANKLKGLEESGALKKKTKRKRRSRRKKRKPRLKIFRSYLYFSGLGYFLRETGEGANDRAYNTFIPFDAQVSELAGEDRISRVISDGELSEAIGKFTRRNTTLVFDTSHAAPGAKGSNSSAENEFFRLRSPRLEKAAETGADDAVKLKVIDNRLLQTGIKQGSVTLWSAVSTGQIAHIAGEAGMPQGLFTLLYVKGLMEGKADANANGIVSNAELLRFVRNGSSVYCDAFKGRCEPGLLPRLGPRGAFGRAAWVDRKKVTRAREQRLSVTRLADFFGGRTPSDFELKQIPPSPLKVGVTDIRYRMLSPSPGFLVLLNLTAGGKLFQLYPNQYAGKNTEGLGGSVKANIPLFVPEDSSDVKLSATAPEKGHIVAVVTPDPVRFDASVINRTIASVSAREAIPVYLARLAAALHRPVRNGSSKLDEVLARWSVVTLPYEILPHEISP